jgi:hypothetical protein
VRYATAPASRLLKRAFVAMYSRPTRGGASAEVLPEPASERPAGAPVAALVPFLEEGRAPRVVLVVAVGLPEEQLDASINMALDRQAADGIVTVFLTDSCEFEKFRERRVLFEYCPPSPCAPSSISDFEWDLFEARRFRLLAAKWQPLCTVALGVEARARLSRWQDSGPAGRSSNPQVGHLPLPSVGDPAARAYSIQAGARSPELLGEDHPELRPAGVREPA